MPSSSRFFPALLLVAAVPAAFAVGWFCRPAGTPNASAPAPAASESTGAHASGAASAVAPGADDPSNAPASFEETVAHPVMGYRQRLRLAQAASGMDRDTVVATLEHERQRHPTRYSDRAWTTEALLARYAEIDAPAAMTWLLQAYRGHQLVWSWQSVVMETWVRQDARGALHWVRGLPAGSLHETMASLILGPLAEVDPELAIRQGPRLGATSSYGYTEAFAKLAEADVHAACERALGLPPSEARRAVEGIMKYWAAHQPEDAYAWAQELPPGLAREQALDQFYQALAGESPQKAAQWLGAHPGTDLSQLAYTLAQTWAQQNLAAARAWSDGLPSPARLRAQEEVVQIWAKSDPRAALDYAVSAHLSNERTNALSSALNVWTKQDPAAALGWAQTTAPTNLRKRALASVFDTWRQEDPHACLDYLSAHPLAPEADGSPSSTLLSCVSQWAYRSPEEAWQWSQGVADPKTREAATVAALGDMTRFDPAGACARLATLPAESQGAAAVSMASQWAQADPVAAAAWTAALPTEDAQKDAVAAVANTWTYLDPAGAMAWVRDLPPGMVRNSAVESVAQAGGNGADPAAVVALVATLPDGSPRQNALSRLVRQWLVEDRPAAEAWVGQAPGLTDAQREQLLGLPPRKIVIGE